MQKVLVFNLNLFIRALLFLLVFCLPSSQVVADSDGRLKLDAHWLTNQPLQAGGVGDFPIRGELFSEGLEKQAVHLEESQQALISKRATIDFAADSSISWDRHKVTEKLFQNDHPQVLGNKTETRIKSQSVLWLFYGGIGLLLVGMGAGIGRKWGRRKK